MASGTATVTDLELSTRDGQRFSASGGGGINININGGTLQQDHARGAERQSGELGQFDTTVSNEGQAEERSITPASQVPDGGYGWFVVLAASVFTFWFNGISVSWGVVQTAMLNQSESSSSTLSFVGTVSNTIIVALGLVAVTFMRHFGARSTGVLGILLFGLGEVSNGFVARKGGGVGGLFGTNGVLLGTGASLLYMSSNVVPTQWFSSKLGLANGIVKGAGGIGGTVLSVALDALIRKVGIPWTFRILGFLVLGTGLPAALLLKERTPIRRSVVQFSMFKNLPFVAVFLCGAIGTFALFVPPFFLPLFAQSIGLSSSTGAALVAAYNLCTTIGRFGTGILCDRVGSVNTLFFTMLLNAVSMLAIWPVSSTMAPLLVFAMLNGIAGGGFFTTFPTVIVNMFDTERSAVAMTMAATGWSAGYLMGAPIAGYLLQSQGQGDRGSPIEPYRPAIFYAGGVACASTLFVLLARLKMDRKLLKKL